MECCRHANPFCLCSGLRVIGYLIIVLMAALAALIYYAVVVLVWGPRLLAGFPLSFLVAIAFHILFIMAAWSYFMVVFRDPGTISENWRPILEVENLEISSSMMSDYVDPEARAYVWASEGLERTDVGYCIRCQNGGPPYCHHCSTRRGFGNCRRRDGLVLFSRELDRMLTDNIR